jgi:hypothetical protein
MAKTIIMSNNFDSADNIMMLYSEYLYDTRYGTHVEPCQPYLLTTYGWSTYSFIDFFMRLAPNQPIKLPAGELAARCRYLYYEYGIQELHFPTTGSGTFYPVPSKVFVTPLH